MKKIEFGRTGQKVSQAGLGCMLMGSAVDKETSFTMLDRYIDKGGNFLDTANCYAWWIGNGEYIGGESESMLGEWMKERKNRKEIFLATKVGARIRHPEKMRDREGNIFWDIVPSAYEYLAPATIRSSVENSLSRLRTDYIDLYYAHIDDRTTPLEETLEVFNQLVKEGKVRFIGCSNLRTWRLERARGISSKNNWAPYVAVQQQYSYLRPKPGADFGIGVNSDAELIDYLNSNKDVSLVAYSPLLKGIYNDKGKRESYYNWHLFNSDDARVRLDTLTKMAKELGVTGNQLVLAWLLHHRLQVIPLLGASNLDQFEENIRAVDIGLSDEHMSALNKASA
jgi:aryl-alcohol dehydrogenase-like predicted oxidoreductase